MDDGLRPFACMLDALQCGASIVDRDGRIVYLNDRLAELMGRPREQVIGTRVADQYSSQRVRERVGAMLERFDQASESEFYLERPDGTRVPVMSAARPLESELVDQPLRIVTIIDASPYQDAMDHVTELSDTVLAQAMELKSQAQRLEQRVAERTAELHEANMEAIYMLAVACEARDEDTGNHVQRINRLTEATAARLGLDSAEAARLGHAAVLHDVGKLHIPDHILKKPDKLSEDERRQMQQHTVVGEAILSNKEFFATARQIARSHHENHDGSGYPDRLECEAVPLAARIVHVVDVYDALTSERVYKKAWPHERAMGLLAEQAGRMFDPAVVDAFTAVDGDGLVAAARRELPEVVVCVDRPSAMRSPSADRP